MEVMKSDLSEMNKKVSRYRKDKHKLQESFKVREKDYVDLLETNLKEITKLKHSGVYAPLGSVEGGGEGIGAGIGNPLTNPGGNMNTDGAMNFPAHFPNSHNLEDFERIESRRASEMGGAGISSIPFSSSTPSSFPSSIQYKRNSCESGSTSLLNHNQEIIYTRMPQVEQTNAQHQVFTTHGTSHHTPENGTKGRQVLSSSSPNAPNISAYQKKELIEMKHAALTELEYLTKKNRKPGIYIYIYIY